MAWCSESQIKRWPQIAFRPMTLDRSQKPVLALTTACHPAVPIAVRIAVPIAVPIGLLRVPKNFLIFEFVITFLSPFRWFYWNEKVFFWRKVASLKVIIESRPLENRLIKLKKVVLLKVALLKFVCLKVACPKKFLKETRTTSCHPTNFDFRSADPRDSSKFSHLSSGYCQ